MADDQLKVDPPTVVFAGDPAGPLKAENTMTNSGSTKLTVKVKVNNEAVNIARPFLMIEGGKSATMYAKGQLPAGTDPTSVSYAVAVQFAEAPADTASDVASIKAGWANITNFKTNRLTVEFKPGEAAPAGEAPAAAEGGGGGE